MKSKFYNYVDGVVNGSIPAGKYIRLAVERFIKDVERKEFNFDYKTGERVVNFSEKLCHHWKGLYAGKPIELLPHQHFYLCQLFGWKREDGTRRFRRSYKEISRKQGKTTECAIKSLYLMTKDGEHGAQIYAGATKEEQATIVVNDAGRIVQISKELKNLPFQLYNYKENIIRVVYNYKDPVTGLQSTNVFKPLGKDSKRQDGFDPSVGIIDEFHAHPDDSLINVIESGMGMRVQPIIDIVTTAGYNLVGPCFNLRRVCIEVLEGKKVDDSLLALIYSLDDPSQWEDPTKWILSNPNMADPVLRDKVMMPYLLDRYKQAKNEGSSKEVDFKTKNLNLWCDAPDVWIPDEKWKLNTHGLKEEDLQGATCFGGLDLASGIDLNAFALYFPDLQHNGKTIHAIKLWVFMPEANVKNNRLKMDYSEWVKAGYIVTTPGNIIDHVWIAQFISDQAKKYNFLSGAYDPYLAHHGCIQELTRSGLMWHPFGQGYRDISTPTKEFEKKAHNAEFEHFGNPVLRWMLGNTVLVKDPNDNVKINKGLSLGKIDGVAAAINALAEKMSMQGGLQTDFFEL